MEKLVPASLLEPNVNYKSVAYHVYLHGFSKALALQVDHLEMLVEQRPEAVRNSTLDESLAGILETLTAGPNGR